MNAGFAKRPIVVWGVLAAVTILQLGLASIGGRAATAGKSGIAAGAIAIALIKVRIIIREFMEVRHAPVLLGRLTDLWVVLTGALLLGGYLAGSAFPKG